MGSPHFVFSGRPHDACVFIISITSGLLLDLLCIAWAGTCTWFLHVTTLRSVCGPWFPQRSHCHYIISSDPFSSRLCVLVQRKSKLPGVLGGSSDSCLPCRCSSS